jgi:hypothetical protein
MMVSSKRTEFATISMSAVTVRRITVTKIMEFVPTLPEALLALAKKVLKVMVLHVRRLLQLPPVLLPLPLLPRLPPQPLLSVMMVSSRRAVSASILTSATHQKKIIATRRTVPVLISRVVSLALAMLVSRVMVSLVPRSPLLLPLPPPLPLLSVVMVSSRRMVSVTISTSATHQRKITATRRTVPVLIPRVVSLVLATLVSKVMVSNVPRSLQLPPQQLPVLDVLVHLDLASQSPTTMFLSKQSMPLVELLQVVI